MRACSSVASCFACVIAAGSACLTQTLISPSLMFEFMHGMNACVVRTERRPCWALHSRATAPALRLEDAAASNKPRLLQRRGERVHILVLVLDLYPPSVAAKDNKQRHQTKQQEKKNKNQHLPKTRVAHSHCSHVSSLHHCASASQLWHPCLCSDCWCQVRAVVGVRQSDPDKPNHGECHPRVC